jgi:glutaredoxin-dependent peroxiredoxin
MFLPNKIDFTIIETGLNTGANVISLQKNKNMSLQPGSAAPQFTLVSSEKKQVSLSDYEGKKVVLNFFPMAFTSVCTTQLCTMRDSFGYYEGLNAVILGISVDSPFTLAKFKELNNLPYDLLSDFNKEASTAYGSIYQEFVLGLKGVSKRAVFVVDEEQKISYAEVLEKATDLPDFDAVAAAVK